MFWFKYAVIIAALTVLNYPNPRCGPLQFGPQPLQRDKRVLQRARCHWEGQGPYPLCVIVCVLVCVHVCKCRSIKFPSCSDTTPISLTVYTLRRTLHLCVLSWRWRLGYTQRGFWSDKLFTVFPLIATLTWSLEWKASIGHMLHIFSTSIVSKVISKQSFLGGGKWKFKRSCSRLFCWCSRAYTVWAD